MTACGFIGMSVRVAAFLDQFVPALHALLARLDKALIGLLLDQRQQRAQNRPAIADESDFSGIAQADPRRADIDLHGLALPGFG